MRKILLTFALSFLALAAQAAPKYIFMFIGDGMGMGHVMAAEAYNRQALGNSENILMMQFPVASWAMTYSADSPITDSAAAGTALAAGVKTNNGMVGVRPDSTAVESIASQLKAKGYGVGLVTSVSYDDATPAAFYAHRPNRGMSEGINCDGAESGFDFIGGSYTKDIAGSDAIFDGYRKNGYTVVHGLEALAAVKPRKRKKVLLTGAEPSGNIGFTIDSVPGAMRLSEMTAVCLGHLQRVSPDGFFMMVESGNIDHAAHGNDGATVVKEVLNFQESIRIAYNFYLRHPEETLIVVTADHDTGGMSLGANMGRVPEMADIDFRRASKEKFNDFCVAHKDFTWEEIKEAMGEKLGLWSHIEVSEAEEAAIRRAFDGLKTGSEQSQKTLYKEYNNFSAIVFDILNRKNGFGFTAFGHTGNPVPLFAVGAGSCLFKGQNNNTDIPRKIREIVGLD